MTLKIEEMLHAMVSQGASDLHLKAGSCPGFRIDGVISSQERYGILNGEMTWELIGQIMTPAQKERFENERDLDFSYAVEGLARFRVNALHQRNTSGLVIRQIPDEIPTIEDLGLPQACVQLAQKPRGLVLVTGPTGSGKSTTLAALINHVNEIEQGHILTMEDPLEFVHPDKKCYVTQRQIGVDCESFSQALRRALRQDPDVIMIGEMRDLETISLAITAAETGHLVFATLHTTSAISTVDRIIDVFPTDAQQQVRVQLASTLQGVISQCLIPKIGGGRVVALEVLVATDGVRSLVREGKTAQILNLLQTGRAHGMTTLEVELVQLAQAGKITPSEAVGKANRPEEVRKLLSDAGLAVRRAPATSSAGNGPPVGSSRGQASRPGAGQPSRPASGSRPSEPSRPSSGSRPSAGQPSRSSGGFRIRGKR